MRLIILFLLSATMPMFGQTVISTTCPLDGRPEDCIQRSSTFQSLPPGYAVQIDPTGKPSLIPYLGQNGWLDSGNSKPLTDTQDDSLRATRIVHLPDVASGALDESYDIVLECHPLDGTGDASKVIWIAYQFKDGAITNAHYCWEPQVQTKPSDVLTIPPSYEDAAKLQDWMNSGKRIPMCGHEAPGETCWQLPEGFQLMPKPLLNAMPERKKP